jgi:hypothetical protein
MNKDKRFDQLMSLAEDGDEDAVGDLWREYGFEFGGRGAGAAACSAGATSRQEAGNA